ncbi:uncharacterized protein HMPREF1541_09444 [Cyphellophora europaea CBS 101466]|uniref:CDP-diacylglycerol-glycerol-3-phosphate 3-phosphatidyltransferase n=1 Tax=Cyphellophora europaea (strain CBS 101466) TaxID=1220924 RepID=W2SA89_CYPE1|nr:uncharacterized protein HMPREF1541_09444 [Cyphellophora europaea CBS 101466]ETN45612.1 hypothetical protein HMPREF1541_09444 [Cyphellophora europaea CBS 101466]
MATASLRQVAVAARRVRISAFPLRSVTLQAGGTRQLCGAVEVLRRGRDAPTCRRIPLWSKGIEIPGARATYSAQSRDISTTPSQATSTASSASRTFLRHASRSLSQRSFLLLTARSTQIRHASSSTPATPPKKATEILKQPIKTLSSLTPHENIYNLPNILTFTRLLAAPAVGYLILSPSYPPIYALSLFFYAGVTDLVDGYLARRLNLHTVVGSVIDPMADKLLMTICTVSLGVTGILPWWAATVIVGRDVALAISAIWWRWISLPPPKTMARYWDFSLPSAEVYPTEISKINTLLQLLLIGNAMLLPVLPEAWVAAGNLWGVFEGWCGLVAGTTVWSGLSYVGNKDAVKIVSQEQMRRALEEKEAGPDKETK